MHPPIAASDILVTTDPLFNEHRSRGYHPERPERLGAAERAVERCAGAGLRTVTVPPRDATDEDILRVHASEYLQTLQKLDGHHASLDPDTYIAPRSVAAARRAAGSAIALVEAMNRRPAHTSLGVALVRPPGHHATRDRGMGFCLLNNVAIAAAWALANGHSKVAIVDWDVHHGNGTQDIFWADPRVLFISLHQFPYYPGTGDTRERGEGEGRGTTVNIPLSRGAGDEVYEAAFSRIVIPVLDEFAPEMIFVSAGYDAHVRDPLADMNLTDEGYAAMAAAVAGIAQKTANGRVALLLEGGYDLHAMESALSASLAAAAGVDSQKLGSSEPRPIEPRHAEELARARKAAAEHWRGL
jgi:acetoin utilization deacetylase AcuC-like enzyme